MSSNIFLPNVEARYNDERLLKDRLEIEANVVACVFKNPMILEDYEFNKEDFLTIDGRFLIRVAQQLKSKGLKVFDEVSIVSNTSSELQARLSEIGGFETIKNMTSIINIDNWDSYYERFKKSNLILKFYDDHLPLFQTVTFNNEKVMPFEFFQKLESFELPSFYETILASYETGESSKVLETEMIKFDDEFMDLLLLGEQQGIPFDRSFDDINGESINCFKFISDQTGGFLEGTLSFMAGYSNAGKALTLDSSILTSNGYVKMKDITMNDLVIGDDGLPHKLNYISPQGKRDIYRITFSDGTYVDASDNHLWNVRTPSDKRKNRWRTMTTLDLLDTYKFENEDGNYYRYEIPMTEPVTFNKTNEKFFIDPYVLGLLLGDGSFMDSVTFTNSEEDIVERMSYLLPDGISLSVKSKNRPSQYVLVDNFKYKNNYQYSNSKKNRIISEIERLGLYKHSSRNKFIPNEYKFGSVHTRLNVLRGLIDTDGTITGNSVEYATASKQMAEDVKFVVETLGGTCSMKKRKTRYTKNGQYSEYFYSYRLVLKLSNFFPFRSKKHSSKYDFSKSRQCIRKIHNIEYIGKQECQCISIDNPSHLFLTNNCIVTHNSTWWITPVMSLLSQGRKVLIVSNEEKIVKYKIKLLVWLLARRFQYYTLTKKKLSAGILDANDKIMYEEVKSFWNENIFGNLALVSVNTADMKTVSKVIKSNVLKYGYDTFLYDTFKISENDFGAARQDLALVRDSRKLDELCKQYNLIGLASVQLAIHTKGMLFLDESCLSNAKQVAEILELLFMIRNVYPEELDPTNKKYYCKPFRMKQDESGRWFEEEYETDPTRVYRMLFVVKSRNGETSGDTGKAYLMRFDGAHSCFYETAQCRPKHGRMAGSNNDN